VSYVLNFEPFESSLLRFFPAYSDDVLTLYLNSLPCCHYYKIIQKNYFVVVLLLLSLSLSVVVVVVVVVFAVVVVHVAQERTVSFSCI
jgi:hypothetical protein